MTSLRTKSFVRGLGIAMTVLIAFTAALSGGCGRIADPDRRVVAEIEGKEIRRSDLKKIIREMSDEERPLIQSQDDLLNTLNEYINDRIRGDLAKQLRLDKKISVPREQARALYFAKHPEYVNVDQMTDPSTMGIGQSELVALQAEMEFGIDDELEVLYREAALQYQIKEYVESGSATIGDEEFQSLYERHKDKLFTLEYIDFIGIRFPNVPGAQEEAVKARKRIADGETFTQVLQSYLDVNAQFGIRASFENDPMTPRFRQFWYTVTGCAVGDILGPVFLPSYDQITQGPNGDDVFQSQPEAWVVLEVLEHRDPRQKTLEESKNDLAGPIIAEQVTNAMRESYQVVVYPEELWRPEGFGNQFKDSVIRTKAQ